MEAAGGRNFLTFIGPQEAAGHTTDINAYAYSDMQHQVRLHQGIYQVC